MENLSRILTELALDPFESLIFKESETPEVVGGLVLRDELFRALDPDSAQYQAIAGEGWDSCDTCSDPTDDPFDPFPHPGNSAESSLVGLHEGVGAT